MSAAVGGWVWEVEASALCVEHDSLALYASRLSAGTAAVAAMQLIDGDAVETAWTGEGRDGQGMVWTRDDGQLVSIARVEVLP